MTQAMKSIVTGRKSVTTSAAKLQSTASKTCELGVRIKADPNNTAAVFVGFAATVTADSADATDGYPLYAGQEIVVPANYATSIYLIAASGTLKVWWMQA